MIRFDAVKAEGVRAIKKAVAETLAAKYKDIFPADKGAPVLIKPNLNSNMNALTGNTTDLRLLAAVIEYLKKAGHTDIAIGEGTNSGFYRSGINVISRLRVDALARHYGIRALDLNYSEKAEVEFENGVKASVARECLDAALLINMPKMKTHFEVGMSVCLKNLMGCLVGQENKKKTHLSLASNILNINKAVRPHLHIVDGLFAMEGLGPTRGTPIKTGMILFGNDPFAIDMMVARIASFGWRKVRTLAEAERRGLITPERERFVDDYPLDVSFTFAPPKAGPIAYFIHNPKRQKYFLAVRNTRLFDAICSTDIVGKLLFATGLRQDVFIADEMEVDTLTANPAKCGDCPQKCAAFCPTGLDIPRTLAGPPPAGCVECMYCYCICPKGAISFGGKMGFLAEQMRQYGDLIRRIA
ncbi:MAG: DUF362 domain-containing protein [Nitrospinae bacterium]|nr:DUF362 domain-containing protein [Nitrospinota bacterium]